MLNRLKANNRVLLIAIFFLFFLSFLLKGIIVLDPDFGWHYTFGEWVVTHQSVPKIDTFSYTMPSYLYVNHEWLTDVFIYYLYNYFGKVGLSILFSLIAILSLLMVIPSKLNKYSFPSLLLAGGLLFQFCGVRPQVISWFFIAFIIRIIFDERFFKQTKWFLPFLFLLWVNLHGAFASGLFLLTLFISYQLLLSFRYEVEKSADLLHSFKMTIKKNHQNILILITSFITSLINPYTYHIWTEVHKTLSSNYLSSYIAEWQSIFTFFNLSTFLLITLSSTLIFIMRDKLNKFQIIIYGLFLILGLRNIRHLPVFALIALPLTTITFYQIATKASKTKTSLIRATSVYKLLTIGCLLVVLLEITYVFSDRNIIEHRSYPKDAFSYIHNNNLSGNIFTDYGWGGYQIWKLDRPTFVDGRMAIWHDHHSKGESANAFSEYINVISDNKTDFTKIADKFQIKIVVWHPSEENKKSSFSKMLIVNYFQNLLKTKETIPFNKKVEKAGFKKIYQDEVAVIYERNSPMNQRR